MTTFQPPDAQAICQWNQLHTLWSGIFTFNRSHIKNIGPERKGREGSDLWFSLGNKPGWQASRLSTPRFHDWNFRTKSIHYWDNFKLHESLTGFFGTQRQLQQKDFVGKWEKFLVINSATQEDFGCDNERVSPCSSLVSSPS